MVEFDPGVPDGGRVDGRVAAVGIVGGDGNGSGDSDSGCGIGGAGESGVLGLCGDGRFSVLGALGVGIADGYLGGLGASGVAGGRTLGFGWVAGGAPWDAAVETLGGGLVGGGAAMVMEVRMEQRAVWKSSEDSCRH